LRIILFSLIFAMISSCALSDREEADNAIYSANLLLSSGDCQGAINALAAIPAQTSNALYYMTYASAYACRAGFNTNTFFLTDVPVLDAGTTDFLNSIAIFTSSTETTAESDDFLDMQRSIELLLHAGGLASPDAEDRIAIFGERQANNINLQALYLMIAQLGKWFHYFGGVNTTTGIKSGCLYTYTNGVAQAAINGNPTGACANPYTGVRLSGSTEATVRRMCYPIVLYNNLIDVLTHVSISSGTSNGELGDILTNVETAYDTVCAADPGLTTLCAVRTVEECVDDYTADNTFLQIYMATFFETTFL
jgi:hypothetical protein